MMRFLLAALLLQMACSPCEDVPVSESVSPDGTHRAVVFRRSCGATTGFVTGVALLGKDDARSLRGREVLLADDDHGNAPLTRDGVLDIQVEWKGSRRLRVECPARSRVFEKREAMLGVAVGFSGR